MVQRYISHSISNTLHYSSEIHPYVGEFCYICTLKGIIMSDSLPLFIKDMRKKFGLTQVDLAAKSGVGLRFVRELEQGKETLRMDKVNQVLALFGHKVGAVPIRKEDEE